MRMEYVLIALILIAIVLTPYSLLLKKEEGLSVKYVYALIPIGIPKYNALSETVINFMKYVETKEKELGVTVSSPYFKVIVGSVRSSKYCFISANKAKLILEISLRRDLPKAPLNIELVFINGSALCSQGFTPLPLSDSAWLITSKGFLTFFNKLTLKSRVVIDLETSSVFRNAEYLGDAVFFIGRKYSGLNEVLILYQLINDYVIIGGRSYGLANILYLRRVNDTYIAKPAIAYLNSSVYSGGIILSEVIARNVSHQLALNIIRKLPTYTNIPSFLRPYLYLRSSGEFIRWHLNLGLVPHTLRYELTSIRRDSSVAEIYGSNVSVVRNIYGFRVGSKEYIAALNMNLNYAIYGIKDKVLGVPYLGEISVTSDLGNLTALLPISLVRSLNMSSSSINASTLIMTLLSRAYQS